VKSVRNARHSGKLGLWNGSMREGSAANNNNKKKTLKKTEVIKEE